jgi:hypothetical protein
MQQLRQRDVDSGATPTLSSTGRPRRKLLSRWLLPWRWPGGLLYVMVRGCSTRLSNAAAFDRIALRAFIPIQSPKEAK